MYLEGWSDTKSIKEGMMTEHTCRDVIEPTKIFLHEIVRVQDVCCTEATSKVSWEDFCAVFEPVKGKFGDRRKACAIHDDIKGTVDIDVLHQRLETIIRRLGLSPNSLTHLKNVVHKELDVKIFHVDLGEFEYEDGKLVLRSEYQYQFCAQIGWLNRPREPRSLRKGHEL